MLDASWISQRPASARSNAGFTLLPQFAVPPEVHTFSVENRPPHLPARVTPPRSVKMCLVAVLCVIGSVALVSVVAEPAMRGGSAVMGNLGAAVDSALQRANDDAERNKAAKAAARRDYVNRRRALAAPEEPPEPPEVESAPLDRKRTRSSLLLRLAALRRQDAGPWELNEDAVLRYFPDWMAEGGSIKSDAALRDIIVAVSLLAHDSFTKQR